MQLFDLSALAREHQLDLVREAQRERKHLRLRGRERTSAQPEGRCRAVKPAPRAVRQ
jgi:hypothetical protein